MVFKARLEASLYFVCAWSQVPDETDGMTSNQVSDIAKVTRRAGNNNNNNNDDDEDDDVNNGSATNNQGVY